MINRSAQIAHGERILGGHAVSAGEYARRSHAADNEVLLAVLTRIEALVRGNAAPQTDSMRAELRMLASTIRGARPDIEQSALPTRAAKLAAMLSLLEERIADLADPPATAFDAAPETSRTHLAVVPPPREPELPIPSPAAPPPAIALAPTFAQSISTNAPAASLAADAPASPAVAQVSRIALAITEIMEAHGSGPAATTPEPPSTLATMPEPPAMPDDEKVWALSNAKLAPPPPNPLAPLMLLSEEERIALFT